MNTFDPQASPLIGNYALVNDASHENDRRYDVKIEYFDELDRRGTVYRAFRAQSKDEAKQQAMKYFKGRGRDVAVIEIKDTGPASMMGPNFRWDSEEQINDSEFDGDVQGLTHYSLSELNALLKERGASETLKAKVKKEIERRKSRDDAAGTEFIINVLYNVPWGQQPEIPTIKRYELVAASAQEALSEAKRQFASEYGVPFNKLSATKLR